ncbi:hypothetical protein [Nocardioides taihuensis]|uniref:Transcriptional regulator, AbiEi antitoxin, Type IV TA system n=1 Tax=Nocardioides taihuensis TaxID=1835606 RepID=A0ABW0BP02_9ACTN
MPRRRLFDRIDDYPEAAVPRERPFAATELLAAGVTRRQLDHWLSRGELVRPIRGVLHDGSLDDGLDLRVAVLRLVVPDACVVTDRTAAWLWGAPMALAPGDHLVTPAVSVFSPPGHRLRNGLVASGERRLERHDVAELDGLRVTTPLRTACDLGRLLHRDQALAGMDALASSGDFTVEELVVETGRFAGYRGVVQLRVLGPIVDPASGSPGEAALRLRWYDAGLPRPQCQVPVPSPTGGWFYVDLGLEELRFGAEYDGEEFHGPQQAEEDAQRRLWLRDVQGWRLVVTRRANVYGQHQDACEILRAAYDNARRQARK